MKTRLNYTIENAETVDLPRVKVSAACKRIEAELSRMLECEDYPPGQISFWISLTHDGGDETK